MEVRPARDVAEQRAALAVNVAAWRAAYDDILPESVLDDLSAPTEDELRERDRTELDPAYPGEFLVAVQDSGAEGDPGVDGVLGFATLEWERAKDFVPGDGAELRAIYVHPDRWCEGIGTALLDGAIDLVAEEFDSLHLQVFEANDLARSFYESRGFDHVGEATYEVADETYPTAVYQRPLPGAD